MASPSPTSRAKFFPTRSRSIRWSRWRSLPAPPRRVRRQDQRGDQCDHALRPGPDHAPWRVTASYGSFGTANGGFNLGYGGQKWGNFISVNGLNSGRFLDPPEFVGDARQRQRRKRSSTAWIIKFSDADSLHVNLGFTRSWFQTPNSFDAQTASPWNGVVVNNGGLDPIGNVVGPADQRSQIKTFNIAPSWTRSSIQHGFHARGLRPPRSVQLLPERQSLCRPRPLEPSAGNGCPVSHAH